LANIVRHFEFVKASNLHVLWTQVVFYELNCYSQTPCAFTCNGSPFFSFNYHTPTTGLRKSHMKKFHRRPLVTLIQILSYLINTFIDSLWTTLVHHLTSISIDPVTNFNLVLANTASAPLHTCQTNYPTAYALVCRCVPCLPHTSPLSPRRASAILPKISWVVYPHHLKPHHRQPSIKPDRCRVPRIPRTLYTSPSQRASRLPAD
jgi:hypothetical protein